MIWLKTKTDKTMPRSYSGAKKPYKKMKGKKGKKKK